MDRTLAVLVLAAVVLTSAVGVAATGALESPVQDGNATDGATVTVSATGTASAEPDRAVVSVTVTERAPTAGDATERLAANVSRLREALDGANLSVTAVETTAYDVGQPADDTGASDYVARHSLAVTTTEPTAAGAVIDVAVANGADEVQGVGFALSDDRRKEARAAAIDAAVTDARWQARTLARSAGLDLGAVQSLSTSSGAGGPVALEAADAGTEIDVSPVSVAATVRVTYNATA